MSEEYKLGFVLGVVIGLFLVMATIGIMNRKKKWQYDERQKLARAKAMKWAYLTAVGGFFVCLIADSAELLNHEQIMAVMTAGMLCSAIVFACVTIHNDAWMALNEKPKSVIGILLIGLAANLILPLGSLMMGEVISTMWINLAVCVMLVIILINYGIRRAVLRRANDEESET